jgi:hypothetical protein
MAKKKIGPDADKIKTQITFYSVDDLIGLYQIGLLTADEARQFLGLNPLPVTK